MKTPDADLEALLGAATLRPWWRRPVVWLACAAFVAIAAAAGVWLLRSDAGVQPHYVTEPVVRGRLVVTVTANGTLRPTHGVDIGSELSGTVARVLVDINDRVRKGQVLAELDDEKLRAQLGRSQAALAVARAKVTQADATLDEARDHLTRFEQVTRLSGGQVPSQAELASARAALARAQADAASARAAVADAQAAASVDATNLRKASIRSPIDGVVLSRSVDPGNAVAASLQAVTLFTLAEDLAQMKLEVNVDEADVGHVHDGQRATFTVSAYPGRSYPARITRIGYGSTTKDNVVTYLAELAVRNDDLTLRPGMTATAVIEADRREDVLQVPNAALRFEPAAPAAAPTASGGLVSQLFPGRPRPVRRAGTQIAAARQVWVLDGNRAVSVAVVPGASDGRHTEVDSAALKPGMAVIVDQGAGAAR